MTMPWLPRPRLFSLDPRVRAVSLAARGLFDDLVSSSDDNGHVVVPQGMRWIDVCARVAGCPNSEAEPLANQLERVGLVCLLRNGEVVTGIFLPDVVRWQDDTRGRAAPPQGSVTAHPKPSPSNAVRTLRAHFSNHGLRTAEERRAWLGTSAGGAVLARLGLDRTAAELIADSAGRRGGQFGQVGGGSDNGDKPAVGTETSPETSLVDRHGDKPSPSPVPSPSEKIEKTEETPRKTIDKQGKPTGDKQGKPTGDKPAVGTETRAAGADDALQALVSLGGRNIDLAAGLEVQQHLCRAIEEFGRPLSEWMDLGRMIGRDPHTLWTSAFRRDRLSSSGGRVTAQFLLGAKIQMAGPAVCGYDCAPLTEAFGRLAELRPREPAQGPRKPRGLPPPTPLASVGSAALGRAAMAAAMATAPTPEEHPRG